MWCLLQCSVMFFFSSIVVLSIRNGEVVIIYTKEHCKFCSFFLSSYRFQKYGIIKLPWISIQFRFLFVVHFSFWFRHHLARYVFIPWRCRNDFQSNSISMFDGISPAFVLCWTFNVIIMWKSKEIWIFDEKIPFKYGVSRSFICF